MRVASSPLLFLLALRFAMAHPDTFGVTIEVVPNASALGGFCTARPCYNATVRLAVPGGGGYAYSVSINENRHTVARHPEGVRAPCL